MRSAGAVRRAVVQGAVAAALVAGALGPHGARAQQVQTFHYVAATGVYTNLDRWVAGERTPAHEAALGFFMIRPATSSFSLTVNDLGIVGKRTVPVFVLSAARHVASCVRDQRTVHFSGFAPGKLVMVLIASDAYWVGMPTYDLGCTGHATGGTASVVL